MPGGGVREENVAQVVRKTGAREIHFTAPAQWDSPMEFRNPYPRMGGSTVPPEFSRFGTDPDKVRRMMDRLAEKPV
jgi:copper homeostasis protein